MVHSLSLAAASRAYSLVAVHGLLSLQWFFLFCGAWALELAGSRVWSQLLWHTGLVPQEHVKSFQTRDGTGVPRIARWILNPQTTRETLLFTFEVSLLMSAAYVGGLDWW